MTDTVELGARLPDSVRSRGLSYQETLDTDTHEVPKVLRENPRVFQGDHDISVDRYLDKSWHDAEKEHLWKKVWQMACRLEEIPRVGDAYVYDITDISILVVRVSEDEVKAYYNVCPHQGRQLRDHNCSNTELRCPFHGFCWHLDGSVKRIPSKWDYPQIEPGSFRLAEVKVGTWGGFVFVNLDPNCEPLADFLGDIDKHFERYPLEDRYIAAHVAKVLRCNWKIAQEAFMEGYHTIATHPQILAATADEMGQYDPYGNYSRAINVTGVPSPSVRWEVAEDDMARASFNTSDPRATDRGARIVPEGMTFRQWGAQKGREQLRPLLGDDVDKLCDSEMMDAFFFTVFPNLHPWGSYNMICYRFRPYGDEHEMSIMETYLLAPFAGERPAPASVHWLGPDETHCDAPELGALGRIFYQDEFNMPKVQKGLHTLRQVKPGVTLGVSQYGKIRHFHTLLDQWVGSK